MLTKGRVALVSKSQEYRDAEWPWLKKNLKSERADLRIEVDVWPREHEPIDPGLTQRFVPSDLAGAKRYMRELIASGDAVLVGIRARANLGAYSATDPGYGKLVYDFGLFEPA